MRLTCSTLSLYSFTSESAIAMIGELGFPALDLVGIPTFPHPHVDIVRREARELTRLAANVGHAKVSVANVVTVPTDGLAAWDLGEVMARVGWAIEAAKAVHAPRLILDAGNPIAGDRVEREPALTRWKSMIECSHELTAKAGIELAVEAPHTGTLAERFDQVAELMGLVDASIGIDFDTSHVQRSGTRIEDAWRQVGGRVVKVSLRDVDVAGEFCRPGFGLVDFGALFGLLRREGFEGDVVLELETPGIEDEQGQRREVEVSRTYIAGLLNQP